MGNHEAVESSKTAGKPGFRLSQTPVTSGGGTASPRAELPDYEDLGSLPATYGEPVLYLVARDPEWFFAYWELPAPTEYEEAPEVTALQLRIYSGTGAPVDTVAIGVEARNWYLPIPPDGAGCCFYGEIGYEAAGQDWRSVARSNHTTVPARGLAEEVGDQFATVPFHLAFQKLVEMVREGDSGDTGAEEPLVSALCRLQGEGRKLAVAIGQVADWSDEQRRLLAALLGHSPDAWKGRSLKEVDDLLRKELHARLSSGGGSESAWPPPEWLSEAVEKLSAMSASSEALMSWARAAAASDSLLSSWSGRGAGPEASRAAETLGKYWQELLSSWGGASGGGASGAFSGSLLGSSWSAQPFGSASRDFFLHVNAEVIFYGGTHPEATVHINGEPVALQPDGTFRHHFRFPDGVGSVPITARSPDGHEERGVLLRFERGTARNGESGQTAQPEELPDPLWK